MHALLQNDDPTGYDTRYLVPGTVPGASGKLSSMHGKDGRKFCEWALRSGQCRRKCRSAIFNKILFITAYRVKIDFNCICNIFSYNAIERYIATTIKLLALSGMQLYTNLRSGDIQQKHLCHRMKP